MKALLVNPSWGGRVSREGRRINRSWPPLDLLNCAALLRAQGGGARLMDCRAAAIGPRELAAAAAGSDAVFVTSSPLDRWQCPNLELDVFLEGLAPLRHDRLFIMGAHGTHEPGPLLERSGAAGVIRGEPEWTVAELCSGRALSSVAGLTWRDGSSIVSNPARPPGDLSRLPAPAFDLLDLELYSYELLGRRLALLEASRGCPFSCAFCMRDMYGGPGVRRKFPAQVASEARAAVEGAGAESGYFMDLEFSTDPAFTREVCRGLRPLTTRWKWCCQTRPDSVDEGLLRELREAGCALVHFGVESGSQRVLDSMGKKTTLAGIERGVRLAREAGLETACFFLLGFPGETDEDRELTLEFARKLSPSYASFHVVTPYPGTRIHAPAGRGRAFAETAVPEDLARRLRRWESRAYRSFYLRPGFLWSVLRRADPPAAARQARLLWEMLR